MERTFTARTDLQAVLLEQALATACELEALTDAAPNGQVLAIAELAAVHKGRELARKALETALQRQAEAVEKKGRRLDPAAVAAGGSSKIKRPRPS